jgi:hypothetical protein
LERIYADIGDLAAQYLRLMISDRRGDGPLS